MAGAGDCRPCGKRRGSRLAAGSVHRGAIVNLEAIDRIERDGTGMEIRIKGRNDKLAVSDAYTRQFRQM
jgi:DNA-binding LytR/AlgR family response regulator